MNWLKPDWSTVAYVCFGLAGLSFWRARRMPGDYYPQWYVDELMGEAVFFGIAFIIAAIFAASSSFSRGRSKPVQGPMPATAELPDDADYRK